MKELLKSVESLTFEELARSYEKFPKFNSPHEGKSVIEEEIEEHQDDTNEIQSYFQTMWWHIKRNENQHALEFAARLRESAVHSAAEAIQVAAMAQKYIDSLGGDTQ